MSHRRRSSHHSTIRQQIAREAARLMYEEGVSEYFNAKRMAAKRLFGTGGQQRIRFRPHDLPSNGEIQAALLLLAELVEGDERDERLFVMRAVALELMEELAPFQPALIGSVSTGHVRRGSDIDLHVFCDDLEVLETHMQSLGWLYGLSEVTIRKGGVLRDFTHVHLEQHFAVELSVYACAERRIQQRSSTDGKPIVRVKSRALRQLMEEQHPTLWSQYQSSGEIPYLAKYALPEHEENDWGEMW